jgi:hypothetical protein
MPDTLLFAFSDFEEALRFAKQLPWTEVWSALVQGDQWTGLVLPDMWGALSEFWDWRNGKSDRFPDSWLEPALPHTLACISATLVEQRWVNPIA